MAALPSAFIDTIIKVNGKTGELWLRNFDQLAAYCENKWGFELQGPYDLSFNFVAPILFKDSTEAVLKLGISPASIGREAAVLRAFDGDGLCKLIDAETDKGILILEKLKPGKKLSSTDDDAEACRTAAKLILKMQNTKGRDPEIFPSIADRYGELEKLRDHFGGASGPIPEKFVKNAEMLLPGLLATVPHLQLFHGDFHHYNILSAGDDDWKLIDPKGLMSEPCYEIASFLINYLKGKNIIETIKARVNIFANELNISEDRILKWGAVHSVISTWWMIEDRLLVKPHSINVAEAFYELSSRIKDDL